MTSPRVSAWSMRNARTRRLVSYLYTLTWCTTFLPVAVAVSAPPAPSGVAGVATSSMTPTMTEPGVSCPVVTTPLMAVTRSSRGKKVMTCVSARAIASWEPTGKHTVLSSMYATPMPGLARLSAPKAKSGSNCAYRSSVSLSLLFTSTSLSSAPDPCDGRGRSAIDCSCTVCSSRAVAAAAAPALAAPPLFPTEAAWGGVRLPPWSVVG
mmetsp:Transcript_20337/g.50590  ORF Transcript_20337/g.50590 Transcript_20337/m.50590 type:complete len:209 (-) Transcript_20337:389-1015(-)